MRVAGSNTNVRGPWCKHSVAPASRNHDHSALRKRCRREDTRTQMLSTRAWGDDVGTGRREVEKSARLAGGGMALMTVPSTTTRPGARRATVWGGACAAGRGDGGGPTAHPPMPPEGRPRPRRPHPRAPRRAPRPQRNATARAARDRRAIKSRAAGSGHLSTDRHATLLSTQANPDKAACHATHLGHGRTATPRQGALQTCTVPYYRSTRQRVTHAPVRGPT